MQKMTSNGSAVKPAAVVKFPRSRIFRSLEDQQRTARMYERISRNHAGRTAAENWQDAIMFCDLHHTLEAREMARRNGEVPA